VRDAHNRSQRLLRGFTVALLACGPVLALAAPAHGDDPLPGDTTTTVAPTDTTTDTTPDTTVPVTTPETTVPVTTPSSDPPVDTTDPPATDPPTDPTSDTTTATTAPSNNETPAPVVVTPGDPPGGSGTGGGSATTGGSKSTADTKHDAAPVQRFLSLLPQEPFPIRRGDAGTLKGSFASISIPVGDVADLVKLPKKLSAQLQALDPSATSGSWTDIGSAAPRFGPWIVLLAMAYVVRLVIASILADRTRGPRRRRWTLL
jgi:hypothetical protein